MKKEYNIGKHKTAWMFNLNFLNDRQTQKTNYFDSRMIKTATLSQKNILLFNSLHLIFLILLYFFRILMTEVKSYFVLKEG